jgi:NTP pyrophosphatase (non-canonical NTP hydrolase)
MNKKTLEELEKELADLKAYHKSAWNTYGSELCAGDMIRQEEKLEKEIAKRRQKQKTINRWKKAGLLNGLTDNIDPIQKINNDNKK